MIKLTRSTFFEKWKVFKNEKWMGTGFYIGPKHGRLVVSSYKTEGEAEMSIQMKDWVIKFLKVKP